MRNWGYWDIGHEELGINWDIIALKLGYWSFEFGILGYSSFESGIFGIPGPSLTPPYISLVALLNHVISGEYRSLSLPIYFNMPCNLFPCSALQVRPTKKILSFPVMRPTHDKNP